MKNQITILFAGGLLAATAVMAASATAQIGTRLDRSSNYIAILQGRGYYLQGRGYANDYAMPRARLRQQYKSANAIDPQDAKAYFDRGNAKRKLGDNKGATAEDGAQASLTTIQPSASILNMPMLI